VKIDATLDKPFSFLLGIWQDSYVQLLQFRFSMDLAVTIFYNSLQQSFLSEPVCRLLEFLLYVINRETSVKSSVAQEVLERDLDFAPPPRRSMSGTLFVPMMRISIVQLEVILITLREEFLAAAKVRLCGFTKASDGRSNA
jgi:hypothetical protein